MQFRLSTLLWAFVVVAMSLAVFGPWGILVSAVLLGAIAYVRAARSFWRALGNVLLTGVVVGLLGCCLIPPIVSTTPGRRAQCANNLKQIGLALLQYETRNGRLPNVVETDAASRVVRSWRVEILPHLDRRDLYQKYKFNERWDGPNNRQLQLPMWIFRCASDPHSIPMPAATNYLAVVGPDAPWGKPLNASSTGEEPPLNPVLVVEVAASNISWSEPRDITFEEAAAGIALTGPGVSSRHSAGGGFFFYEEVGGANMLFADTSVRFVSANIPRELLDGVLRGEPDKIEEMGQLRERRHWRIHWPNCCSLAGLVVSAAWMLFRPRKCVPETRAIDS